MCDSVSKSPRPQPILVSIASRPLFRYAEFTSSVIIYMYRPRTGPSRLIHPHGNFSSTMSRNGGFPLFGCVRSRCCAVRIQNGIFRTEKSEVNWFVGNGCYVLVIEIDERGIERGEDGRMDGIESFVVF